MPHESYRDTAFRMAVYRPCILADDNSAHTAAAHELGHLLYLDHQLDVAPNPDTNPANPVRYNHPHFSGNISTLMVGGPTACPAGCAIANLHSDPQATYPGTTIVRGHSFDRDDKRMIFETFQVVSRYKNPNPTQVVVATPTCTKEYTGCVGNKKRYFASWYQNDSQPFARGYAQYSTNNGSTWVDLVNGGQSSCTPVVPASTWIIRAWIRTAVGDSGLCFLDIIYGPCDNDPPL